MKYSELTTKQKYFVEVMENLFLNDAYATTKDFIISLAFLINKYKK